MIESDLLRQLLLGATATVFVLVAVSAVLTPSRLAAIVGFELSTDNAISEFHAIYVGIFAAQGALCAFAAHRVTDAAIGDLAAAFVLAQPAGRLVGLSRGGIPTGVLRLLAITEVVAGIALLLIRPSG